MTRNIVSGNKIMGIKEQIKKAGSEADIQNLLNKIMNFDLASDRTKNACKSVAKRKLDELKNSVPPTPQTENVDGEQPKPKVKKVVTKSKTKSK